MFDAVKKIIRPLVTVDLAIFTIKNEQLHILLTQRPDDPEEPFPNMWALPGGFLNVMIDDDLEQCALRKLKEKTNVQAPYLEQVGAWGSKNRDPRDWSVTHVYFSLLNHEHYELIKGGNVSELRWFPITDQHLSLDLAFDHQQLFEAALQRLQAKVEYTSLPVYLLPETFTLPDLQSAYEIVLNRNIDKSSFRTRMLASELLQILEGQFRPTSNRPAQLYSVANPAQLTYFPRSFKYNENKTNQ